VWHSLPRSTLLLTAEQSLLGFVNGQGSCKSTTCLQPEPVRKHLLLVLKEHLLNTEEIVGHGTDMAHLFGAVEPSQ